MPTGGIDIAALATFVGTDAAAALGTAALGAEVGGAVGFGSDLIEGKDVGKSLIGGLEGAGAGGITGGAIGLGPEVGGALGIGSTAGSALTGAAGGALGQFVTGGNPLAGAAEGSVAGGVSGALSGAGPSNTTALPGTAVSGGSAASPSAPVGVAPGSDVTSGLQTFSSPSDFPQGPSASTPLNTSVDSALGPAATPPSGGGDNATGFVSGGQSLPGGGGQSLPGGGGQSAPSGGGGLNTALSSATSLPSSTPLSTPDGSSITGAAGGNSISKAFSEPSFGNIGTALGKNAGILTSLAGLGTDIAGGMSTPKGESQLLSEADQLSKLGATNEGYLASGQLPAGAQAGINQATQSAIAAIRSKYASMGMSGSSAEQADIQAAQTNAQAQGTNIALQLMQQGANETGMASEIYTQIMQGAMKSDQNFSSAFTNLASAVGGGTGGQVTIKTG